MHNNDTKMVRYQQDSSPDTPRYSGIRTFMRLPHVTSLDGVDFAIVGVPFDTGGTYRVGARFAPSHIRDESFLLKPYNPALNVNIFDICSGVDYGDLPTIPGYLPETHQLIQDKAGDFFSSNVIPVFLGGDHSVSLPLLRAAAAKHGPLALVHFDAHNDLHRGYFGGQNTHGTPFRRALEENLIDPNNSCQTGIRGSLYDSNVHKESEEAGFLGITGPDIHQRGISWVLESVRARVGNRLAYLTFDIDFVDPAYAPGTGTPVVGGLSSAQCLELVRGLAGLNFVAFDIVEVVPSYDHSGITSLLAASIVYEFISLIALKQELKISSKSDQ
jgi:agmatinase